MHPPRLLLGFWIGFLVTLTPAWAEATPPRPVKTPAPVYPLALAGEAKAGQAVVTFTVGVDGRVRDAVVKEADDPAFGEAALAALADWEFEPATRDGAPIERKVSLPFAFKPTMDVQLNKLFGRTVFARLSSRMVEVKDLKERPKPVKRGRLPYPKSKLGSGEEPTVRVRFVVGPDGQTYNPEVVDEVDQAFVLPALAYVVGLQYDPIKLDGEGVAVQLTLPVRFRDAPAEPAKRDAGGGGGGGGGGDGP